MAHLPFQIATWALFACQQDSPPPEPSAPANEPQVVRVVTETADQTPDLLVGELRPRADAATVSVVSIRKRERTSTVSIPRRRAETGFELSGLGQSSWVAVIGFGDHARTGRVFVRSVREPSPFVVLDSSTDDSIALGPCGNASDVDRDGQADFWLSIRSKDTGKYAVEVRSGSNGQRLASVPYENGIDEKTPKLIARTGCIVMPNWEIENGYVRHVLFGDFNHDEKLDCILVRWLSWNDAWHLQQFTLGEANPRVVRSWEGSTGNWIYVTPAPAPMFGCPDCLLVHRDSTVEWIRGNDLSTIGSIGDTKLWVKTPVVVLRDREGAAHRLAVAQPDRANGTGEVLLFDCSATPEVRSRIRGEAADRVLGSSMINIGDITDDGIDDLAVVESTPRQYVPCAERVLLFSTTTGNCVGRIEFCKDGIAFR